MQIFNLTWNQVFKHPEKAFLFIGLLFGICFLFIVPPFQVPDEPNHFFRAYQLSEGKLVAEVRDNTAGGILPQSLWNSVNIWQNIPFHKKRNATKQQFIDASNISLKEGEKMFITFANTTVYSPIPYLPQLIGITIGKAFSVAPVFLMYLGRLTNLLISLYISFLAIKNLPIFKWVFFLLALTPMAMFQRSSLSPDSLINSIAILLIAIIVKYAFDENKEKIATEELVLLCLLGIFLSLSKQAYFLLPFLCFLIPKTKIGDRKKYFLTCSFISLVNVIAWIAWVLIIKKNYVPLRPNVAIVNEQAHFVLSDPIRFAAILLNDLEKNLLDYFEQFIGLLGWLDTCLPDFLLISYGCILVGLALINTHPNIVIKFRDKLKIFSILSASIFLIYLLIYLSWTPVGKKVVEGVQGRYFIPVSPLSLLLLYNRKISLNISSSKLSLLVCSYSFFILTITLSVLLHRYYDL